MFDRQKMQDKLVIAHWVKSRASYTHVANLSPYGLVNNMRFSERARGMYLRLWDWSAVRLSSYEQEKMWHWAGHEGISRRIARARRISEALMR